MKSMEHGASVFVKGGVFVAFTFVIDASVVVTFGLVVVVTFCLVVVAGCSVVVTSGSVVVTLFVVSHVQNN